MNTRSQEAHWFFPDIGKHRPNCDNVKPEILSQAIVSHWPLVDGIANIPYHISVSDLSLGTLASSFITSMKSGLTIREALGYANQVREDIKAAFNNWSKASNGTVSFYESNEPSFFSKGIYIHLTDQSALMENLNAGATTYTFMDNNGDIGRAIIYYPVDKSYWETTHASQDLAYRVWAVNGLHHEIGHALGFQHLHEYSDIQSILKKTPDGLFCSVMPYPNLIQTPVSECHQYCDPYYAVFPAELDVSMLNEAYQNNMETCSLSKQMIGHYFLNALNVSMASLVMTGGYRFLEAVAEGLEEDFHFKPKAISPKKTARIIADSSYLAATIYMQFPVWTSTVFAVSAATKYLPESVLEKLPSKVKWGLQNNYSAVMLNFTLAYLQGQCFVPWLISTVGSSMFGVSGWYLGMGLGRLTTWSASKIFHAIEGQFCHLKPTENTVTGKIEPKETTPLLSPNPKANLTTCGFFGSRISDGCQRLKKWWNNDNHTLDLEANVATTNRVMP